MRRRHLLKRGGTMLKQSDVEPHSQTVVLLNRSGGDVLRREEHRTRPPGP